MSVVDERARECLELRRAGVAFDVIVTRLEYGSLREARAAYKAALAATDQEFANQLEADRLDRLQRALWPQAVKGDVAAIDRVLRISERREKLLAKPKRNTHEVRRAFDAAVESSSVLGVMDAALVAAGAKVADRIDAAVAEGEGQELTKALYLTPHLLNVLREALATPAARKAAGIATGGGKTGKLATLRAVGTA